MVLSHEPFYSMRHSCGEFHYSRVAGAGHRNQAGGLGHAPARSADDRRAGDRRGVIFAGALDRVFSAYDSATGVQLWKTRLNDVPNSSPITYMVNGKQYIALTVGNGGGQSTTFPPLVPEIRNPPDRGAAIWVFELED